MNVTVIGSTGRTGSQVLAEGRRRGHRMTAFTRRPETLAAPENLAAVVAGDGRDPEAVRRAVRGADAVISIVSAPGRGGPHQAAAVARVLTTAMAELGVRRLAVTSAYPIVAERPRVPMAVLRWLFRQAYADASEMERIVMGSDLDWTVVRLGRLTNGPARGGTRTTPGQLDRTAPISRADAAALLLDVVADPATARTALNAAGPVGR